jgi:hypothetical protein
VILDPCLGMVRGVVRRVSVLIPNVCRGYVCIVWEVGLGTGGTEISLSTVLEVRAKAFSPEYSPRIGDASQETPWTRPRDLQNVREYALID